MDWRIRKSEQKFVLFEISIVHEIMREDKKILKIRTMKYFDALNCSSFTKISEG